MRRSQPGPVDPFRSYSVQAARRYDDWYGTAAGRAVAEGEQAALVAMLATLPVAPAVLEVGCGSGHFTRWLATRGGRVLGVDPSAGMIAVAREASGAVGYVLAAAEALPFADRSVDVVAFITTLEFLPDPTAALAEAARLARTGILLGVLNLASPLGVQRRVAACFRPSVYRSAHFYTAGGLQRLVQRALPGRVEAIHSTTTLWPGWMPQPARRLPCGAFIAMAVRLYGPAKEIAHA